MITIIQMETTADFSSATFHNKSMLNETQNLYISEYRTVKVQFEKCFPEMITPSR